MGGAYRSYCADGVMMYPHIEKRLIQALSDTENMTPSIRELARELNCTPKLINTKFTLLAGKVILKRKAEIKEMNSRRSINSAKAQNEKLGIVKSVLFRNCLCCDSEFKAVNRFNRLCDSCKNKECWL